MSRSLSLAGAKFPTATLTRHQPPPPCKGEGGGVAGDYVRVYALV